MRGLEETPKVIRSNVMGTLLDDSGSLSVELGKRLVRLGAEMPWSGVSGPMEGMQDYHVRVDCVQTSVENAFGRLEDGSLELEKLFDGRVFSFEAVVKLWNPLEGVIVWDGLIGWNSKDLEIVCLSESLYDSEAWFVATKHLRSALALRENIIQMILDVLLEIATPTVVDLALEAGFDWDL